MTDAHCHLPIGGFRHFVAAPSLQDSVREGDVAFVGVHPWAADSLDDWQTERERLASRLAADQFVGVGEIGLDRLKDRAVSPYSRSVFEDQLRLAADFRRPVVLHGAKCWGQVVDAILRLGVADAIPAFVFHGFSRSEGLVPQIAKLHGFVSVGPAVLNDHAVNYRRMVRDLPNDILLIETDRTAENAAECPSIEDLVKALADLRGTTTAALESMTDRNADEFVETITKHKV